MVASFFYREEQSGRAILRQARNDGEPKAVAALKIAQEQIP
jgi:hypothetical protein